MDFGGPWTQEKLEILEHYLDAYTTALKNKPFKLLYIDAFAGTGKIETQDREAAEFLAGSPVRAIAVDNRPFDELIFVEKHAARAAELQRLRDKHPHRNIKIENAEANDFLRNLRKDWRSWRGVLFLDPFATEVQWSTMRAIARFNALDTWVLFPVAAIARMLPRSRRPDDISPKWANRLTSVFGDESWRELYRESEQRELFGEPREMRDAGIDGLLEIYKTNLRREFGKRFLQQSRPLFNSTGSRLFEFMFCAGNPRGIKVAHYIAGHIVDRM